MPLASQKSAILMRSSGLRGDDDGHILGDLVVRWGVILSGLLASQGFTALAQIVLARSTTPEQYALYLSSISLLSLLVVLPGLGLDTWLLVRGAARPEVLLGMWSSGAKLRALALIVWLAGIAILLLWLPADRYPASLVICLAIGFAFDCISLLNAAGLRAAGRHLVVTLIQATVASVLLAGVLIVPSGTRLILFFAVMKTILSAGSMMASLAAVRHSNSAYGERLRIRDIVRESMPFLVSDLAVVIYLRADVTIVTLLLGSQPASVYGPAVSLVNLLFLVPNALYLLVTPVLARMCDCLSAKYWLRSWVQLGAQLVIGIGLMSTVRFLAPAVVDIVFGPSYAPSAKVLVYLSLVPLLKSLNFGLAAVLVTARRQMIRTIVQVACAVLNVAGNLFLAPRYGLRGVAWVYIASEAVLLVGYGIAVAATRRSYG